MTECIDLVSKEFKKVRDSRFYPPECWEQIIKGDIIGQLQGARIISVEGRILSAGIMITFKPRMARKAKTIIIKGDNLDVVPFMAEGE